MLQGLWKKIKALINGPLEILDKARSNSQTLTLPPYMCIYLLLNVDILKPYEPSMPIENEKGEILHFIDYWKPYAHVKSPKDMILQKKIRTIKGQQEIL